MWQHVGVDRPLPALEVARVDVAPLESALLRTINDLRGSRPTLHAHLRGRDIAALRPLIDYRTRAWPGRLTAADPCSLDALLAEADGLAHDVIAGVRRGRLHADAWAPVLDAPERWLRSYAVAIGRVCDALKPEWRRSAGLVEREVERVSIAAAHDNPGVVLRPLLVPGVRLVDVDEADRLCAISYPVKPAGDDAPAALDELLAPSRAAILRSLDRPTPAGGLAESLGFSPSGITHHLGALERAGLIARERLGRRVLVHRTDRGTGLLALYAR
jgi:DNA-binding transcriptional ArsR family regulator